MSLETWLTFTLVTSTFLIIPGPTILLVISYSLTRGKDALLALVFGVGLGDLTAMTFSFIGVGVLLQTVAVAFQILKWIGAAYLIWLGIKMWRSSSESFEISDKDKSRDTREIFRNAYITTALNPKSIVFFLAFMPQFMDAGLPFISQAIVLGSTFFVIAIFMVIAYALLASYAGQKLQLPSIQRRIHQVGGSVLVGAGGMTAVTS